MGNRVQKLVVEDSFDANGTFVPAGQIGSFDVDLLTGKEPHLHDVGEFVPAVVEIAPIGPTGPNPTEPQQLPPEARQGPGGGYVAPGRTLVGEVTQTADKRFSQIESEQKSTAEGDMAQLLADAQAETARLRAQIAGTTGQRDAGNVATTSNDDDDLVAGTVAEISASLGAKTDEELTSLRSAEIDREKPRKGVLDAIKAEQAARQG